VPLLRKRTATTVLLTAVAASLYALGAADAIAPDRNREAIAACLPSAEDVRLVQANRRQEALVTHLSRRFQIAAGPLGRMVEAAYRAAGEVGLDPLLVLAVIAVESRFNPIAESGMGAQGLMQIIPRFHRERFSELGGPQAVLDPEANILVGARILQDYIYRSGTLEAGLQYYNGAFSDGSAQYAHKVMAERARLELAMRVANDSTGS
jgi:soluble lytic murein transglycosylase-like protein